MGFLRIDVAKSRQNAIKIITFTIKKMKGKSRLLELDCLRGIAALVVVFYHFSLGHPLMQAFFKFGITGVDLFFIISGFVIFLTIEKTSNYRFFLLSRFARLYPAYWICVTITALSIILGCLAENKPVVFPRITDYLINLTMFQYYLKIKNIDDVYWTLIIELLFYLFILTIYLTKKIHKIEFVGYSIVLLCLAYAVILRSNAILVHDNLSIYLPIINYFPLFIAGIVFYKIKFERINASRLILLVFCLVTQIFLFSGTDRSSMITQLQYAIVLILFFSAFFLYCFDLLGFIINKPVLFFGKISYSLYLIHCYISVKLLIPLFKEYFHLNLIIVQFLIVLPIVVIIATIINKFVEVPAMNYLKRKIKQRKIYKFAN